MDVKEHFRDILPLRVNIVQNKVEVVDIQCVDLNVKYLKRN